MKKLFLLLIVGAIISAPALAQDKQKDVKQDRAEWEKKIKEELKLNVEQTEKFNALNKEYNDKMDVVMSDASLTKESQKERKMALKKEKETKLFEFLTPEQQVKYRELIEKKKKDGTS